MYEILKYYLVILFYYEQMRAEDIQEQLQSLKDEVRRMGRTINRVQEEDVRFVFGEQIRPILMENVRRAFESAVKSGMSGRTSAAFESSLYVLIDRFITILQRFDTEHASSALDQGLVDIRSRFRPVDGDLIDEILSDIEGQMRQYLIMYGSLDKNVDIGVIKETGPQSVDEPVLAGEVESVLSPLSSAVRYEIMITLKARERGLTEISRALNLQKGHLQFHVKTLMTADYIGLDKTTHQYYLTSKGETALKGIEELVKSIQSA